jgi:hypothetical protein
MYWRVFGTNQAAVPAAALLEHLHARGFAVTGHFRGDDKGWFLAELLCPNAEARLELQRFLATEEGIRGQLNTWAAWLETACPSEPRWMQHLVGTSQVFTLHSVDEDADEDAVRTLAAEVCSYLAQQTGGIVQIDGEGFVTAHGALIAAEECA